MTSPTAATASGVPKRPQERRGHPIAFPNMIRPGLAARPADVSVIAGHRRRHGTPVRSRREAGSPDHDDECLVQRVAIGDVRAFEALVSRHEVAVFRKCVDMLGDRGDAEEAAQDVFLAVWGASCRLRGECRFSTWLYRVTTNQCLNQIRRRRPQPAEPVDQAGALGIPEAAYEGHEDVAAVAVAVARLSVEGRSALLLRGVDGLAYAEIAAILGVSVAAVKSRLNRARSAVALELGPRR